MKLLGDVLVELELEMLRAGPLVHREGKHGRHGSTERTGAKAMLHCGGLSGAGSRSLKLAENLVRRGREKEEASCMTMLFMQSKKGTATGLFGRA